MIGVIHTQIVSLGMLWCKVDILQRKNPAWFQIHAGFYCELEGLSPDGGLFYSTNKENTLNRRAARPVAERR